MLLEASVLFQSRGMDWAGYYHQTGRVTFPEGSVPNWNTNDHGVNNAERGSIFNTAFGACRRRTPRGYDGSNGGIDETHLEVPSDRRRTSAFADDMLRDD